MFRYFLFFIFLIKFSFALNCAEQIAQDYCADKGGIDYLSSNAPWIYNDREVFMRDDYDPPANCPTYYEEQCSFNGTNTILRSTRSGYPSASDANVCIEQRNMKPWNFQCNNDIPNCPLTDDSQGSLYVNSGFGQSEDDCLNQGATYALAQEDTLAPYCCYSPPASAPDYDGPQFPSDDNDTNPPDDNNDTNPPDDDNDTNPPDDNNDNNPGGGNPGGGDNDDNNDNNPGGGNPGGGDNNISAPGNAFYCYESFQSYTLVDEKITDGSNPFSGAECKVIRSAPIEGIEDKVVFCCYGLIDNDEISDKLDEFKNSAEEAIDNIDYNKGFSIGNDLNCPTQVSFTAMGNSYYIKTPAYYIDSYSNIIATIFTIITILGAVTLVLVGGI